MIEEHWICSDCGMDTTPCIHKRGCRHKGRWEDFMVSKELWLQAVPEVKGIMCVTCFERRLGRELTAFDFIDSFVNWPHPWDTPLLASRKANYGEAGL